MTTFISLLRGINVSGHNLIKMEALGRMYEKSGFRRVTTYLQSGNVIFEMNNATTHELAQKITQQIEKDFGFNVPVIVLSIDSLKQIIDNNPLLNDNEKNEAFFYVTFLSSKPEKFDLSIIEVKKQSGEEIFITDNAAYLYCPNGYGNSKLSNSFLETKLKVGATTRNWKTTNELLKLATKTA